MHANGASKRLASATENTPKRSRQSTATMGKRSAAAAGLETKPQPEKAKPAQKATGGTDLLHQLLGSQARAKGEQHAI